MNQDSEDATEQLALMGKALLLRITFLTRLRVFMMAMGVLAMLAVMLFVELPLTIKLGGLALAVGAMVVLRREDTARATQVQEWKRVTKTEKGYYLLQAQRLDKGLPAAMDAPSRWSPAWWATFCMDVLSASCIGTLPGSPLVGTLCGGVYLLATRIILAECQQAVDQSSRLAASALLQLQRERLEGPESP